MTKTLVIGSSGYVGTYLVEHLSASPELEIVTCDVRLGQDESVPDYYSSYLSIPDEELREFSSILFFAGCSSVGQAERDPMAALRMNALELVDFATRIHSRQRLIYASSASVYSHPLAAIGDRYCGLSSESDSLERPSNAYDASKAACDLMMPLIGRETTALRMGTVCGYSASLRPELVFNAMSIMAGSNKPLTLRNANAWRAILHLPDLLACIEGLIAAPDRLPSVLNVASMNIQMGSLASRLASHFGVSVIEYPDSPTYSFALDTSLSRKYYTPQDLSLEEHSERFIRESITAGVIPQ